MTRDVVTIIPLTEDQERDKHYLPAEVAVVPHLSETFEVVAYLPSGADPTALLVDSDGVMFPIVIERLLLVFEKPPGYVLPTGQLRGKPA